MIVWPGFERKDYAQLSKYLGYVKSFKRPTEVERNPSLWGSQGIDYNDIYQGSVGDCYMVSVASALAEWPARIQRIFVQNSYNKEGIFALNLYVKGKPTVVTVDDKLPFTSSTPLFAKPSPDRGWWLPILEKAYAKINVNYETIGFGWMSEAARILTGAPSYRFASSKYSPASLFSYLQQVDSKQYVLTAASLDSYNGLAKGHAYSLLGTYELKSGGRTVAQLIHMRNPWAREGWRGDWSDSSSKWTSEFKKQVPYVRSNDGSFFISPADFIKGFRYFTVTFYEDDHSVSYYEQKNFRVGQTYSYTFSVSKTQKLYAGADTYVERMYPSKCRGTVSGSVRLLKGGSRLG